MPWTPAQKIAFRFFACYIFLYTMSNQFVASFAFEALWQQVVPWFAKNILQMEQEITVLANGSGDMTYNYLCLVVFALISGVVTVILTVWNPQKPSDQKLLEWFVVLIRYYLIFQMVTYGLAKLFYLQFQEPNLARLIQPFGEASPMRLLWTFMGFSMGYTIFTGFAEFLGGMLLLIRKTRTLGALIVFGVMVNVMAMNYFYDVPVKILSTHLVFLSGFLLIIDGERLWNFFFLNKPVEPRLISRHFENEKLEKWKNWVKWLLITGGLGFACYFMINAKLTYGPAKNLPKLYGLHEVEKFERNGQEVPALVGDSTRWKHVIIERKGRANIENMNDQVKSYDFVPDSSETFLVYNIRRDTSRVDTFFYTRPDSNHLEFTGMYDTDTLRILLKTKQKKDFPLMNRGFRWINEYPHNR